MWTLCVIFPESQRARANLSGLFGRWSTDNLVLNDHKVAEDLKRVIERELQDEVDARPDGQSNVSRPYAL